jgi:hypothetical protein
MKKEVFLIFFSFIFLINYVYAIGISPPRVEIDYQPNFKQDFKATVLSTAGKDIYANIFSKGPIKDYIKIKENRVKLPKLGSADIYFSLELPPKLNLPPGKHYNYVMVEEGSSATKSPSQFNVMTSVGLTIVLNIPYPKKYLELIDFDTPNIKESELLPIKIESISRGNETINKADFTIEIYKDNIKLETLYFDAITNIKPGDKIQLFRELDTKDYNPGSYQAKLKISYDNEIIEKENNFNIGTLLIQIANYTKKHYQNQINKFEIEAQSYWNDPIENIYAEVIINNLKLKTNPDIILPFKNTTLTTYFDTNNFQLGYYNTNITLYYSGRSAYLLGGIEIIEKPFSLRDYLKGKTTQILILAIIILLILNLLWLIKKKKNE